MAYPMASMPTLDEFVSKVNESYDVKRYSGVTLIGDRGETTIEYLVRRVDGRDFDVTLPRKEGPLNPHEICRLCKGLNIPSEDFGLNLGDLPAPDNSFSF